MLKSYYQQDKWAIYYGDCREILPQLDKASAIVTDPPYELGFMGKSWDSKGISFQRETWGIVREACLSGAMLLSFGGTRTFHRIACAIEDAGWEIRDTIAWVYGSGFPKSLDVSKALDYGFCREQLTKELGRKPTKDELKEAWAKFREVTLAGSDGGHRKPRAMAPGGAERKSVQTLSTPATPEAQLWNGYGTALKPAYEPIILAMNPLDGTFANNALKHGVAGLNIDECRIPTSEELGRDNHVNPYGNVRTWNVSKTPPQNNIGKASHGRFPANFIHDGSQMVMELFPETKSGRLAIGHKSGNTFGVGNSDKKPRLIESEYGNDSGSAARFFYCAKASKTERNKGCEDMEATSHWATENKFTSDPRMTHEQNRIPNRNNHPTVKPLALMTYLVKLVKMPEYNSIRDPFMGSGTTLLACIRLGIPCIGIDNDEKSCEIAAKRCCQEVMELV